MQVPQYVVCCSLARIFSSMRDMTTILRKDVRNWLDWPLNLQTTSITYLSDSLNTSF